MGALLEQDGKVVAYSTCVLSSVKGHYSVIQRECLAVTYEVQQFRYYLLGRPFKLLMDHAHCSGCRHIHVEMEGLVCVPWQSRYNFATVYQKGSLNANADALYPDVLSQML